VVLGAGLLATATASSGGAALSDARIHFTSSDTAILAVHGDSLIGRQLGTVTVTASLVSSLLPSEAPSDSSLVTVVPGSVSADSASLTFASIGDTVRLTALVLDADSQPVTGVVMQWRSSDTSRVDVSVSGRVTAKRNGTAQVIATASGKADTVPVTVAQVLVRYTFNASAVAFTALTQTAQVTATPRDARGNGIASGAAPSYAVNDASVASVNAATGLLTALLNGSTHLVASRGTVRDSVQLLVSQKAKTTTVTPKPAGPLTSVGDQLQLNATAVDSANVSVQGAQPAWISSNTSAASISSAGLVTAVGVGSGYAIATLDGKRDSVAIVVTNNPATVTVTPDTATATSINDTLVFTAAVLNGRGTPLALPVPTWRTPNTDTAIVTVLIDGRVIAKRTGVARIIATAGTTADTGIAVITNVAALIDLALTARTLTALADVDTPAVLIQSARGDVLPRNSVTWSSDDPAVARVNALGTVTAVDTGVTTIRAIAGFVQDSVSYTILNTPTSVSIILPQRVGSLTASTDTLTGIGQSLGFKVDVRNHRNAVINNYPVLWTTSDAFVVDTVINDTATAIGFGSTTLAVTAGTVSSNVRLTVRNLTRLTVDNSTVASPRVGTTIRPFATIQDAVNAADANDTVVVKRGSSGGYRESVALTKKLFLLGDSTTFISGRNPANLPIIAHDTGAAALTAITSAPMTIRYLTIRHTLDGAAIDADGSDVAVDNVYVNPNGLTTTRIGRGFSIRNSLSGTRITNSVVDSVRGYGLRLEAVSNATVRLLTVVGVDSLPGVDEGAGIKIVSGNANKVNATFVRAAQVGLLVSGGTNTRLDSNIVWRNVFGMRVAGGTTASVNLNDVFDNDSLGLQNPAGPNLVATNDWWGDVRGPRLTTTPLATGDSVNGSVTFNPFRTTPFLTALFAGPVAQLRLVRGGGQSAVRGTTLLQAFTVRVVDASGFPVSGVSATFAVTGGGGSFGSGSNSVSSDASGLVERTLTLGAGGGLNTVTVTIALAAGTAVLTITANGT
jgi:hypothetical protein